MIAALLPADSGRVLVDGVQVEAGKQATQARMGVLSDARGLYPRLSARENIAYYGVLHGMTRDEANERATALADALDMRALMERRCEGFSQGEKMKTALARALVHDPQNIILDEPTNGLDVLATRALREFLAWLKSPSGGSKCILFSTHIMQEVERLCDHVVIVAGGETVAQGTVAELLDQAAASNFEDAFVKLAFA
jgi:sodium transport system ATP-binding protein